MFKVAFQLAALYVGAVVGAGFASGQEIVQFFGAHGTDATWIAIVSTAGFIIIGLLITFASRTHHMSDFGSLARYALGARVGKVYEVVLSLFLLSGLAVMLAGAGALCSQELGLPPLTGSLITAIIIYTTLLRRLEGVVTVNSLLVPILIKIILITCTGLPRGTMPVLSRLPLAIDDHWLSAAGLYVVYNSQLAIVALAPAGSGGINTRSAISGVLLASITLAGLVWLMIVSIIQKGLVGYDVPMARAAAELGTIWGGVYALALWCALLTTGLATALGLDKRLYRAGVRSPAVTGLLTLIPALIIARFGFTQLVSVVYPLMGYLALPFIIGLGIRYASFQINRLCRQMKGTNT